MRACCRKCFPRPASLPSNSNGLTAYPRDWVAWPLATLMWCCWTSYSRTAGASAHCFKPRFQAPQAAVIVLTSLDDEQLALQAVREGAQDYLIKGRVDRDQLARAICYAQQRKQAQAAIQQRSRELAALNSISRTLSSSMKLSDVLKAALHSTLDALGLAAGCIHLLDRDSQELVLAEQTGLATELTTTMSRIPVGVGVPGRAAETCSVVVSIGNVASYVCAEPEWPIAHSSELCCFLSAPLRSRGRVVGVISAVSYSPRSYPPGRPELCLQLATRSGLP